MDKLAELAQLIKARNVIDDLIAAKINRPALVGHMGEYIASQIFDIKLCDSATNKAIDGFFNSGKLMGKSVNIKYYGKAEHLLDITPNALPDYYLVLTGPRGKAVSSKGQTRPFAINSVFLFDANKLIEILKLRKVKIGIATSVINSLWDNAEIYPEQGSLQLTEEIRQMLAYFYVG
ncbi:MAG: hypothetical protein LLG02_06765 [Pelosinus sp.]|nr:hypothetical protein [Pelosinus sp.]